MYRQGFGAAGDARGGLEQCALCQGAFPPSQLEPHGTGRYCSVCAARLGPGRTGTGREDVRASEAAPLTPLQLHAWKARYAGLKKELTNTVQSPDLLLEAAHVAERIGDRTAAIVHYRQALALVPQHPLARARLRHLEPTAQFSGAPAPPTGHTPYAASGFATAPGAQASGPGTSATGFGPAGHRGAPDAPPQQLRERKTVREAPPFWHDLGSVFAYPFHGKGKAVLAAAAVFFAVADIIATLSIVGIVVAVCIWGYVLSYFFSVISATAAGKDSPPEFPEVLSLLDAMVFPLFAGLTCMFVAFLPFATVVIMAAKGILPAFLGVPFALVAFAFGFFVLPMSFMARALFQDLGPALSPRVVLSSIGRIFPDYLAAFMAICGVWVLFSVVHGFVVMVVTAVVGAPTADAIINFDTARIMGWLFMTFVKWPLLLMALMVEGHLLGKLYKQGALRLAWFHKPTEATVRAHKLSGMLAVGAIVAGAVLTLSAWGTWTIVGAAARGVSAVKSTPCPVRDGTSMTYYFENTDGPAGLVKYDFRKTPSGDFMVLVSSRRAEFGGMLSEPEPFATFDPGTALWTSDGQAWAGETTMLSRVDEHVPFYGPKSARIGGAYINSAQAREVMRWQNHWDTWRVVGNNSTSDWLYDQRTGLLVGKRFTGVGFQVTEWLTEVENLPGLGPLPPPNRNFADE